jgi:hypothetical protein
MLTKRWMPAALLLLLAIALIGLGCGGDDENGGDATTFVGAEEEAALQEEIEGLSDEEQIKRLGNAWADLFAAGDKAMCPYMHPDIVPAPASCEQLRQGAFTNSVRIQRTYEGATVTDVTVMGETATARFSNGESVEFQKDPDGDWKVLEASPAK